MAGIHLSVQASAGTRRAVSRQQSCVLRRFRHPQARGLVFYRNRGRSVAECWWGGHKVTRTLLQRIQVFGFNRQLMCSGPRILFGQAADLITQLRGTARGFSLFVMGAVAG